MMCQIEYQFRQRYATNGRVFTRFLAVVGRFGVPPLGGDQGDLSEPPKGGTPNQEQLKVPCNQ